VLDSGEAQKEVIRPDFNRAIMIDFQGAKITSDVGFLLVREIDDRFRIIDPMKDCLEDLRSPTHKRHSLVQMVRQRVYQIAAGYEDCNDADFCVLTRPSGWRLVKISRWEPASLCSPGWRMTSLAMKLG
jgi:hypothetical protein